MRMNKAFQAAGIAAVLMSTLISAGAAEFTVNMQNKGEKGTMVFEPDLVRAAPGDTINFVSVDAGHNAESIKGMYPEGTETFKSQPSKDFSVTLTAEGVYGVRCTPHFGLGMVMLVVVGKPTNLAEAEALKLPGKAKARLKPLFEELKAQ